MDEVILTTCPRDCYDACGVAAGFAGLLEADLTYDRKAGWTIAEIAFPI